MKGKSSVKARTKAKAKPSKSVHSNEEELEAPPIKTKDKSHPIYEYGLLPKKFKGLSEKVFYL